jgi:hypothetical protein
MMFFLEKKELPVKDQVLIDKETFFKITNVMNVLNKLILGKVESVLANEGRITKDITTMAGNIKNTNDSIQQISASIF